MILGIDHDTRAVHCVLLDDDSNAARYIAVPFVEHKPPFRFDDARNVRGALMEAIRAVVLHENRYFSRVLVWDDIWLVGVEKPYSQNKDSSWKYGLVVGQILSCVPRSVPVLDLPPTEWKRETVGKANASKDEVAEWVWHNSPEIGKDLWPQDAFDAYCLARAARSLNARGIAAA